LSWLAYHVARSFGALVDRELEGSPDRGDGYILPDERARQAACAQLAADPDVDAAGLDVRVLSGQLQLSGSVSTAAMKQRALAICARIPGVTSVEDAVTTRA